MSTQDPRSARVEAGHDHATDHLSPDEHRRHAEQPAHGGHGEGQHGGHAGHGDHAARFRDRFWLSLALALPVVVYSEMVQEWLGYTPPRFPGSGGSRRCSAWRCSCMAAGRSSKAASRRRGHASPA